MLEHGASVDLCCSLRGAVASPQSWSIVPLLLSHGADANLRDSDANTPLMRLFARNMYSNHAVLFALLRAGADASACDARGATVLDYAMRRLDLFAVRVLLQTATLDWQQVLQQTPQAIGWTVLVGASSSGAELDKAQLNALVQHR